MADRQRLLRPVEADPELTRILEACTGNGSHRRRTAGTAYKLCRVRECIRKAQRIG